MKRAGSSAARPADGGVTTTVSPTVAPAGTANERFTAGLPIVIVPAAGNRSVSAWGLVMLNATLPVVLTVIRTSILVMGSRSSLVFGTPSAPTPGGRTGTVIVKFGTPCAAAPSGRHRRAPSTSAETYGNRSMVSTPSCIRRSGCPHDDGVARGRGVRAYRDLHVERRRIVQGELRHRRQRDPQLRRGGVHHRDRRRGHRDRGRHGADEHYETQ